MNIIIINNAAKESTVLKAFLPIASKRYKNVCVVFPSRISSLLYTQEENVKICTPGVYQQIKAILRFIKRVFTKYTFIDIRLAKSQNKASLSFIMKYMKAIFMACIECCIVENELKFFKDDTYVFSMWYAENAIAAAMVKYDHPEVVTASYAHSYEVDPIKNQYVGLFGDQFKERFLDRIFFISEVVMNNYLSANNGQITFPKKYMALHFGSIKKIDRMCKPSTDGFFRILTCSGLSPVKRLHILAEALLSTRFPKPIIWTILGDGPEIGRITDIVNRYDNVKVTADIRGRVNNDEVHKYYSENPIDLFINISSSEGLPVSIMEAMSYGVPALATDVGGNREIVNNETGLLIDADITTDDVANALVSLMSDDLNKKREAAYLMWKENYQIENNVLKMFAELDKKRKTDGDAL